VLENRFCGVTMRGRFGLTSEGIEANFAINYPSRFALTEALLPCLVSGGLVDDAARILLIGGTACLAPVIFIAAAKFIYLAGTGGRCPTFDATSYFMQIAKHRHGRGPASSALASQVNHLSGFKFDFQAIFWTRGLAQKTPPRRRFRSNACRDALSRPCSAGNQLVARRVTGNRVNSVCINMFRTDPLSKGSLDEERQFVGRVAPGQFAIGIGLRKTTGLSYGLGVVTGFALGPRAQHDAACAVDNPAYPLHRRLEHRQRFQCRECTADGRGVPQPADTTASMRGERPTVCRHRHLVRGDDELTRA